MPAHPVIADSQPQIPLRCQPARPRAAHLGYPHAFGIAAKFASYRDGPIYCLRSAGSRGDGWTRRRSWPASRSALRI